MEIYIWKDLTFELAKDWQRNQLFATKSLEAPPGPTWSRRLLGSGPLGQLYVHKFTFEKWWFVRRKNLTTTSKCCHQQMRRLSRREGSPRCKSVTELMKRHLLLRLLFLLVLRLFPTSSPSSSLQFKHLLCGGKGVRSSIKSLSTIYTKVSCAVIIWTPRTSHPKTQTESRNNKKSQMKWRGKTNNSWFGGKHFKQSSSFLPRSMSS